MIPFLTLYTPTFRRPQRLAQCLASVGAQTAADDLEQIVIPDHVGVGIAGMYARVPLYAEAVHGRYVTFLCDDDVLASPHVVEQVRAVAAFHSEPPLLIVRTNKGGAAWPSQRLWPPVMGTIDLNCAIVRTDVWRRFVHAYASQMRYEGDFDFLDALARAGIPATFSDILFSVGAVSRGAAEAA